MLEFNMSSIFQGADSEKTVVDEYIDADGYLTLQMGYWVFTFQDGEIDYSKHTDGTVTFQVKVK
ncbi:MAG: hypothetical protein IH607_06510 [Firmicutes bacterium]|nr:hypothetical protein [Bacillota bacterium]